MNYTNIFISIALVTVFALIGYVFWPVFVGYALYRIAQRIYVQRFAKRRVKHTYLITYR